MPAVTKISIYEQELFGAIHWRVMRDDGRLIFDRHQTDFESKAEALQAIAGEFRRKQLGDVEATAKLIDRHANGRRRPEEKFTINAKGEIACCTNTTPSGAAAATTRTAAAS